MGKNHYCNELKKIIIKSKPRIQRLPQEKNTDELKKNTSQHLMVFILDEKDVVSVTFE